VSSVLIGGNKEMFSVSNVVIRGHKGMFSVSSVMIGRKVCHLEHSFHGLCRECANCDYDISSSCTYYNFTYVIDARLVFGISFYAYTQMFV